MRTSWLPAHWCASDHLLIVGESSADKIRTVHETNMPRSTPDG